jgi:hypothetical protein
MMNEIRWLKYISLLNYLRSLGLLLEMGLLMQSIFLEVVFSSHLLLCYSTKDIPALKSVRRLLLSLEYHDEEKEDGSFG